VTGPRVLVTGGAGFLGRHLVRRLAGEGRPVTAVDVLADDNSRFGARWLGAIPVTRLDVHDTAPFAAVVAEHDVVVHAASHVGVQRTIDEPVSTLDHIAAAATLASVARPDQVVLFLSSSEVYGLHSKLYQGKPMAEEDLGVYGPPHERRWHYARMKAVSEGMIAESRARTIAVRVFNCYGPGLDFPVPRRVIAHFLDRATRGEPLVVNGDGTQTRSHCFVDDMVDGLVRLIDHAERLAPGGHDVFNLGNADATVSVRELAGLVADACEQQGLARPSVHIGQDIYTERFDDSWHRVADSAKARAAVGFRPSVPLTAGLAATAAFHLDQARVR
jgi:nucleoside-diphosphate-sugar epimerase